MRVTPQGSHSPLFLPALWQASHGVEAEYLYSFPSKHRFLTCQGIGLSELNPVAAPGVSLLRGRVRAGSFSSASSRWAG